MKHIPKQTSQELKILSFKEAVIPHRNDNGYDRSQWIYIPDFYSDYRYILGTAGAHPLITIGVNPSTASPGNLDPTLKSVQNISSANGFDSFIMLNLYAQRATAPDHMDAELNQTLHEENTKAFRWILEHAKHTPSIWAAWGTNIEKRKYLKICLTDMAKTADSYAAKWYRTGNISKNGHPHHPLYLKKDSKLEPFDIGSYLDQLISV